MHKLISLHQKSTLTDPVCICGHEGTVTITITKMHHQQVKEITTMVWCLSSEFYCFKCLQLILNFLYIFPIPQIYISILQKTFLHVSRDKFPSYVYMKQKSGFQLSQSSDYKHNVYQSGFSRNRASRIYRDIYEKIYYGNWLMVIMEIEIRRLRDEEPEQLRFTSV